MCATAPIFSTAFSKTSVVSFAGFLACDVFKDKEYFKQTCFPVGEYLKQACFPVVEYFKQVCFPVG